MKKIILFLLLNIFLFSGFSQSLQLFFEDEVLSEGQALTIMSHADSGAMSFEGLEVTNNSINPLNVKCAREVITEVVDTDNSFCWGVCYSTTTDTATVTIKINPGEISNEFVGDYFPDGNPGITTVKYIFFDVANPDDQVTFIINYKATIESGINVKNNPGDFSPAYPNPANKEVSIDYSINSSTRDVKFVIYNLLGTVVKEEVILDQSGSLTLNIATLTEGIYFYSLLISNEPTLTQKLIIKH